MKRMSLVFATAMVLLVAASRPSTAANLLVNGGFDSNLAGWQFPDATPIWIAFDGTGSATSGSALGSNTQAAAGTRSEILQQCVPINQTGLYVFGASAYTPTGQVDGNLVGSYSVIVDATCSSGFINSGGFFMPSNGQWTSYTSGTSINVTGTLPPAGLSILITMSIDKAPAGGTFSGYFDNVFVVHDAVFANGFQ